MIGSTFSLGTATTTTPNASVDIRLRGLSLHRAQVFFTGTWTGTARVEVSVDDTTWVTAEDHLGNAISTTSNARFNILGNANYIRLVFATASSGTVGATVVTAGSR